MTYYCPNCHGYRPPRFVGVGKPRECAECGGKLMSLVYLLETFDDLLEACRVLLMAAEMYYNSDILLEDEFDEQYPKAANWTPDNIKRYLVSAMRNAENAIAKTEPKP